MLWVSPVLFDCHIRMTNRNIRDKLEQDRPISANQEGTVRAMGRNVESMEYLFETERLRIRKFESTDAQCLYEAGRTQSWRSAAGKGEMRERYWMADMGSSLQTYPRKRCPFAEKGCPPTKAVSRFWTASMAAMREGTISSTLWQSFICSY